MSRTRKVAAGVPTSSSCSSADICNTHNRAAELLRARDTEEERTAVALRINADHARSTAFLIHDGVVPSNDGRGYVLRKIMRRAMRNGRLAGATEPYFHRLTAFVADLMKPAYPELQESVERVSRIVRDEVDFEAVQFDVWLLVSGGRLVVGWLVGGR